MIDYDNRNPTALTCEDTVTPSDFERAHLGMEYGGIEGLQRLKNIEIRIDA